MNIAFIVLWCLFNHVFADYFLQGCLANLKQKSWWKENAPESLYKYDYIMGLIMHSISWTFCVMLPIAFYKGFNINDDFVVMFLSNVLAHAYVDDAKANRHIINLVYDQILHIMQIAWSLFVLL